MAKQKLFNKPFDKGTLTKLKLYRNYLTEWLPVFNSKLVPITDTINVFDFFAGEGCDVNKTYGSPMIAIDVMMNSKYIGRKGVAIHLHLNDHDAGKLQKLKQHISNMNYNPNWIKVHYYNEDAISLFDKLESKMKNAANLIFFDQFGIKYVDKALFLRVAHKPMTDFIFFVSSNTYNRFPDDKNVTDIIGLDSETIKKTNGKKIHELVTQGYQSLVPNGMSYYVSSFSIEKGKTKNIYGLIFGSGHPLGIEKFLKVCWKEDELAGAANYDIEGDQVKKSQLVMFDTEPSGKRLTKIESFQQLLESHISSRAITTDKDIVAFMLKNGFIDIHAKPVIQALKNKGEISYNGRLSYSSGMLYKKPGQKDYRDPKSIILKQKHG